MSIGILYEHAETDEMGIKLTAKELGMDLVFIPFRKIALSLDRNHYSIQSKDKSYAKLNTDIEVILNRCQSRNRRLLAANVIESLGKYSISSSLVEYICFSKLRTILRLWQAGVKTPKTVYIPCDPQERRSDGSIVNNIEDIAELLQVELGLHHIVVKPDAGSRGKNIHLAKTKPELLRILKQIKPSIINPVGILAQEYIQKWFYDLRIIVSKEAGANPCCYPRAMARAGFKDFRTNTSLGNMAFGIEIPHSIQKKASKCAEVIGGNNGAWVLALDAMIEVGEDKTTTDEEVKSEFKKLTPYFNEIKKVKSVRTGIANFPKWNNQLENAFQHYMDSDPYGNVIDIIEESINQKEDSVLFHEVNSCPEFWEQTRLVTGVNVAIPLFECAQSLINSNTGVIDG